MISIDRVYQTLKTLANTDTNGNARPDELRMMINLSVNEIVEEYLAELNRLLFKENIGRINNGIENLPDRIREKLQYFLVSKSQIKDMNNKYDIPSDLLYIDTISSSDLSSGAIDPKLEYIFEECKSRTEFKTIRSVNASVEYPIYLRLNDKIIVYPNVFNSIDFYYLRKHKIAKWTFVVVSGNEVFNPGAPDFQDIDLHPSEESSVITKTLEKLGINLKEQDLTAIASQKDQLEFNKQNA